MHHTEAVGWQPTLFSSLNPTQLQQLFQVVVLCCCCCCCHNRSLHWRMPSCSALLSLLLSLPVHQFLQLQLLVACWGAIAHT